jgi:hypothetical protein
LLIHSGSISASADDGNVNQQLIGGGNVALTTNGIQGVDNTGQKPEYSHQRRSRQPWIWGSLL